MVLLNFKTFDFLLPVKLRQIWCLNTMSFSFNENLQTK